ncbi:MAG TPA: hypothetical protein PKE69_21625 [Pyrinomonadaceae bacterium]|nr:hypothetical protein [Pyrinomonadaceae bacterium]
MIEQTRKLGKLVRIHPISPAVLQRAVIVAMLSFLFFLATMIGVYTSQKLGFFLLSTAFLIVNIFTMFGLLSARKNVLNVYENGFSYKKFKTRWDEIERIEVKMTHRPFKGGKIGYKIIKKNDENIFLDESIHDINRVIEKIDSELAEMRAKEKV